MKPTFSWVGNINDLKGTATFSIGEVEVSLYFQSFKEANHIYSLIEEGYNYGFHKGRLDLAQLVKEVLP